MPRKKPKEKTVLLIRTELSPEQRTSINLEVMHQFITGPILFMPIESHPLHKKIEDYAVASDGNQKKVPQLMAALREYGNAYIDWALTRATPQTEGLKKKKAQEIRKITGSFSRELQETTDSVLNGCLFTALKSRHVDFTHFDSSIGRG